MAYEPKTWECGEVITAEDLNHLEGGVEDANAILPEATASDNGKVLGVDNGEYALVEQSGGEEVQRIDGINASCITKVGRLAIVTPKLLGQGISIPPINDGGYSQPTGAKIDASFYGNTDCVLGSFINTNDELVEMVYLSTFPNHIAVAVNGNPIVTAGQATVYGGTFSYICEE